ncbi:MAG: PepSY domain-containing protein [Oscillospiraceae bacterium]|jgi:uncharacterized membrane protein YkoI|nr:PepSY domain-containing protein [Oscillospiraceae bacterium]
MEKALTKKIMGWLLLPLLCAALLLVPLAGCANAGSADAARLRPDMTIIIDGVKQAFYNANGQQVHPILYSGTTYLPVRAIGELMGKNVDWNEETKTVTLGGARTTPAASGTPDAKARAQDITVEVRSDFTVVVDSTARTFTDANGKTVYPVLYNGSTYLPVRAVGELMGKSVAWDSAASTVTLSGGTVTDADSFSGGTTPSGGNTNSPAGQITPEDAKAKALAHAGVTASGAVFTKVELDWEDGRQVYEVEFYTTDGKEYDYELDAKTGEVIGFDYDAESYTPAAGNLITREKAQEIALSKVPGAAASHIVKLELDYDDGVAIYEVEIIYNGMEYEMEINASTGSIIAFEGEPAHR